MSPSILGRKVGMTQIYLEDGRAVPVTVIQAGPCHVLQVRSQDRDGYQAVQLGFEDKPRRLASRAERGHVAKLESKRSKQRSAAGVDLAAKAGCEPQRFIREFRGEVEPGGRSDCHRGSVLGSQAGRCHRHQQGPWLLRCHEADTIFSGQRATHGVKKVHRHPGSTGCSALRQVAPSRGGAWQVSTAT